MVKVRVMVKVRFRVQKDIGFDPRRHSEPSIWVSLPYKQSAFIIYDNDVTLKNMFKRI